MIPRVCPRCDLALRDGALVCPLCHFAPPPAVQPRRCGKANCGNLFIPRKRQQTCDECQSRRLLRK